MPQQQRVRPQVSVLRIMNVSPEAMADRGNNANKSKELPKRSAD
jgi:hypothetical protein